MCFKWDIYRKFYILPNQFIARFEIYHQIGGGVIPYYVTTLKKTMLLLKKIIKSIVISNLFEL